MIWPVATLLPRGLGLGNVALVLHDIPSIFACTRICLAAGRYSWVFDRVVLHTSGIPCVVVNLARLFHCTLVFACRRSRRPAPGATLMRRDPVLATVATRRVGGAGGRCAPGRSCTVRAQGTCEMGWQDSGASVTFGNTARFGSALVALARTLKRVRRRVRDRSLDRLDAVIAVENETYQRRHVVSEQNPLLSAQWIHGSGFLGRDMARLLGARGDLPLLRLIPCHASLAYLRDISECMYET